MSLLSASEMAAIQNLADNALPQVGTILRRIVIQTPDGQESVWATSGLDVPCWVYQITPLGGVVSAVAGAVAIAQNYSIRMPHDTDCIEGDHIVVEGQTYLVEQQNAESGYLPWLVCGCRTLT